MTQNSAMRQFIVRIAVIAVWTAIAEKALYRTGFAVRQQAAAVCSSATRGSDAALAFKVGTTS
jgi:hypothetical protein